MLEESISCSPGNDKDRSRSRRFHRATKRRSQRQSGATQKSVEVPCLDALYEDTDESVLLDHFNPFENERILAAADAVRTSQSKTKFGDFSSQGFVRLEQLPVNEGSREHTSPKRSEECSPQESWNTVPPVIHPILGPETQFGISNSEFVRFCDEVEIDEIPATQVKPKSVVDAIREDFCESPRVECPPKPEATTRRDPKSIVDAILEDFCGSPYSESPPRLLPEDATPIFRFKSKTLRTYSGIRPRKSRRNIAAEMAVHGDDGHASDSSSGLSVQEDLSQNFAPELDTVNLNNSIKVCENLLNLSSYFTQTTSHENSPPLSGSTSFSTIIEEIIKLKGRTRTITRSRSIEEFLGFSDQENESNEDTLKELLEDEDDVLQQINCDSLCYETVVPKKSVTYDCSELECTLQEAKAVIEEANRLILSIEGLHAAREESGRQSLLSCDKHEDASPSTVKKPPLNDKQLLDDDDDIDLWNDNDCLLSYKTQKFYSSPGEPAKKVRCLSPGEEICQESLRNEDGRALMSNDVIQFVRPPPMSLFAGFSTASRKPIAISDEAKRKADEILSKFESEESEQRVAEPEHSPLDIPGHTAASWKPAVISEDPRQREDQNVLKKCGLAVGGQPPPSLPGFTTASRKPVVISEKAKQMADEMLAKFEKQEAERNLEEGPSTARKSEQSQWGLFDVKFSSAAAPISVGFSTASRKPIAVSEKAKRKADAMLRQFEEEEREKIAASVDLQTQPFPTDFPSFSTASKKPIVVSDEAKRKADNMLKKFEEDEREKRIMESQRPNAPSEEVKQKAEELLVDIEFFEEAFEEELKGTSKEKHFPRIENSSKTATVPIFEGFKTASRKSIQISEAARKHAEKLVQNVVSDDLPQDFLKCIESDVEAYSKPVVKVEQVDGAPNDHIRRRNLHESPLKSLPFLAEPAEIIENLPSERNSLSQSVLQSSSSKRKRDSEGTQNENAPEPTRRLSFNERTPLNRIENGILHKTTSLSAIKPLRKSSLISRKNLLSLSKRKKCNNDTPSAPKTPEKAQPPSECNANETPDLKQFFDSVSTSTPRLTRTGVNKVDAHDPKDSSIESDFRPINWEDGNESGRVGLRTSFAGDPNIMSSQIIPSPLQRIERLKMYGEPPPISPILMANKCRPSGLRKARSFVKP